MISAKEYLEQVRNMRYKLIDLQKDIEKLRTDAESVSINLDGMPKGSGKGTWENLAIQLAEYESEMTRRMSELWEERIRAAELIAQIQTNNNRHVKGFAQMRMVLREHYLEAKTFEQIAYDQGLSVRHCERLNGWALVQLDAVMKKNLQ